MGNIFSGCCSRSSASPTTIRRGQDAMGASLASGGNRVARTRGNMTAQEFELALRAQATNPPRAFPQVIDEQAQGSLDLLSEAYWRAKKARAKEIGWDAMLAERAREAEPRPPFDYRTALHHRRLSELELASLDRKAKEAEFDRQSRALGFFPDLYQN